jgi:hypothetical protein
MTFFYDIEKHASFLAIVLSSMFYIGISDALNIGGLHVGQTNLFCLLFYSPFGTNSLQAQVCSPLRCMLFNCRSCCSELVDLIALVEPSYIIH